MILKTTIIIVAITVTMWMFRIDDPHMLLLPCLLIAEMWCHTRFRISAIDCILACICLYDVINWCMYPSPGTNSIYTSITCFVCYIIIRKTTYQKELQIFFLKLLLWPIAIAMILTIVSFAVFIESVHKAGFTDIYPLRHLFTPFGYITNAWSSIYLPLLGLLTIGYNRIPKWRILFGSLFVISSIAMLFSFSRGAFIAWGVYMSIIFLLLPSWKKKLSFFIICIGISGIVWGLFPVETTTTLAMNKTISQQQSTESRFNTTQKALKVYKSNNVWTGVGQDKYTLAMDKILNQDTTYAFTSYAPNIVVQLMIEKGGIGLALYIILAITIMTNSIKQRKQIETWLLSGCLLALAIKEMTMSIMLNNPAIWLLTYILLAFLEIENTNIETIQASSPTWRRYAVIILGGTCFIGLEIHHLHMQNNRNNILKGIKAFEAGNHIQAMKYLNRTSYELPLLINRAMLTIHTSDTLLADKEQTNFKIKLNKAGTSADTYVHYIQAKLKLQEGKVKEASSILQTLATTYTRNASYMYDWACTLYKDGKKAEATAILTKALWLKPKLLHTTQIRSLFANDSVFRKKIIKRLTIQLAQEENTPNAYARYGYLAYYTGNKREARNSLQKALDAQPGLATPWFLIGKLCEEEGKEDESKIYFRKYSLLTEGAFSNNNLILPQEQKKSELKLLFEEYAKKFQNWYGYNLLLF